MEKIQALNYSRQAIPDLLHYSKMSAVNGHAKTAFLVKSMAECLRVGQKFVLPFNGRIFDSDVAPTMLPKFHLPYPMIVVEFPSYAEVENAGSFSTPVPKRIALCCEVTGTDIHDFAFEPDKTPTGVAIWPINFMEGVWSPSWIGAYLKYGQSPTMIPVTDLEFEGEKFHTRTWTCDIRWVPLGEIGKLEAKKLTPTKASVIASIDTGTEIDAVIQLCAALECNNVSSELIEPPEKLNKKLKKEGKLPLFSYRVLVVNADRKKTFKESSGSGTHASPRTHLRRGHIRHLSEDRFTWVTSCVVKPGHGFAAKDYAVVK